MKVMAQDVAISALRDDIRTGRLSAGEKVVQESLAERYGVSRVPLREALATLEAEGLVAYQANRGYYVAELRVSDLLEVYRMRELLEAEAIRLAVPNLSDAEITRIGSILGEVESAAARHDLSAMTEANRRFHFALFDAAGMPRLSRFLRQLWDATEAYRAIYYADSTNRERVGEQHRDMLEALRRRDIDQLIVIQDLHRSATIESVRHSLTRSHAQEES